MSQRPSLTRIALVLSSLVSACTPAGSGSTRLAGDGSVSSSSDAGSEAADGGFVGPPEARLVPVDYDSCTEGRGPALQIPIQVDDRHGTAPRDPAQTGFLVPLAEEAQVYSLDELVVRDESGARLSAQFEALARWSGHPGDCERPLRYAYAHVNHVPSPGARVRWFVHREPGHTGELTTLSLEERTDRWVIDTGVARFTVRRDRFQGLSAVELPDGRGGHRLLSALADDGGGFFLSHGGTKGITALPPWALRLERRGPQRVTVAARGFYAAAGGARDLAYTVRIHFSASSAVVRVEHTYYYGEVAGWGADGATNTTVVDRAWMSIPLAFVPASVVVRAAEASSTFDAALPVRLEQEKRSPGAPELRYAIVREEESVERGVRAQRPYLGVVGEGLYAGASVARLAEREPQGLRYNAASRSLELDFTSSPMQIGGARGIWSVAALDFGLGEPNAARFDQVQEAAERPLLGAPEPAYVNATRTLGPYAEQSNGPVARWSALMSEIHGRTRDYLAELRITGLQLWPDLPRSSCYVDVNCEAARAALHEGGDNNYWNWSKVGVDEFFRTGDNAYLHDFSLGEATTMIETIAFRTYHDRIADSSVAGLGACYGDSRGYQGDYREGLNNRRDRCVADYTYAKTAKLAFLATADARFVDYFEDAGESVINSFGAPPLEPEPFLELTLNRLSEQRLELLASAAEFGRDLERSSRARTKLRDYVDFMLGRTLIDGHACETGGSGQNDARALGYCASNQGWMMPVAVEWALRTSRILGHPGLAAWVVRHGQRSAEGHTTLDARGVPDFSRAVNEWRSAYRCQVNAEGVDNATCEKRSDFENDGRFYANGLLAYLNVFGLVLAADPSDPHRICSWLPAAYTSQLGALSDFDINARIWGKTSGQAFSMSAEAVGALSRCPR